MNRPLAFAALCLLAGACSSNDPPAGTTVACTAGTTLCFADAPGSVLECTSEATWQAKPCGAGELCYQDHCQLLACVPGAKTCRDGGVVECKADGSAWSDPLFCATGKVCDAGGCKDRACTPAALRCADDGRTQKCNAAGSAWESAPCAQGTRCVEGVCLPASCTAGQTECGPSTLYTCDASSQWKGSPCPDAEPCVFGKCVQCVADDGCDATEKCQGGACVVTTPKVTTDSLPPATAQTAYTTRLTSEGGKAPFSWTLASGTLPAGIQLSTAGDVMGTPTGPGTSQFTVRVADGNGANDSKALSLEVLPKGQLAVTTATLPDAEMGLDYATTLSAAGGEAPYAWQVLAGPLPQGLGLSSTGTLAGIPDAVGTFPLTFRVFDSLTPPGLATKDLSLTVKIAPLSIVGTQEYNLLITKVIILPTLVVYIPYSTDLTAKGGLRPYSWSEEPAPPGLSWLIPNWGFPSGLTMSAAGKVSGWVTDVSDATVVTIPFTTTKLTGYFVNVKVTDSQNPAASATAIYCLPTVPLGP